jgi:hypothetical protein
MNEMNWSAKRTERRSTKIVEPLQGSNQKKLFPAPRALPSAIQIRPFQGRLYVGVIIT